MIEAIDATCVARAPDDEGGRSAISRTVLRTIAWIWIALLTAASLQPARLALFKGLHRELHWVAFAGAALLLLCMFKTRWREFLGICLVFLLGISLEVLQHLMYRNCLEWRDIGDDGLAILAAFALYHLTGAWKPRPGAQPQ